MRKARDLRGTTFEMVAESPHPQHICESMLLVKIYRAQNNLRSAILMAYKVSETLEANYKGIIAGQWRTGLVRLGQVRFELALMLIEDGQVSAAPLQLEGIAFEEDTDELKSCIARALWFLANHKERHPDGCKHEVSALRLRAKEVRLSIKDGEWDIEDSDEGFMRLCNMSLWH
ncbi:hypothetical protein QBC34DRAFT_112262 [Podospora aff. communis PSN243]|uniref:Uncharacterized protein n=1 Tax=Podospora aff. communis PSN243 TaxID=3040156 RepID=A0AAV9GPQ8_9PEZI|nr:hypothetical protein QBC34DRAFT_112262 [Podospora aff. communis PSN243]